MFDNFFSNRIWPGCYIANAQMLMLLYLAWMLHFKFLDTNATLGHFSILSDISEIFQNFQSTL